jgi:hypothetical protein
VVKERGKRKLRKVVTGDPDKRVRDHMREVPQVSQGHIVTDPDNFGPDPTFEKKTGSGSDP